MKVGVGGRGRDEGMGSRTVQLCFYSGEGVLVRVEACEVGECETKAGYGSANYAHWAAGPKGSLHTRMS